MKRIVAFLLIISVLLTGCIGEIIQYGSKGFGITRQQYNCSWKLPSDNEVIEISEKILRGDLVVLDSMDSLKYENLSKLDWNVQYTNTPNTFQLYLQSLNPIVYLTAAYELSGNNEYIQYAEKIIKSWINYKDGALSEGNSFVWYDHGTALRAENLIYYALVADENKLLSK